MYFTDLPLSHKPVVRVRSLLDFAVHGRLFVSLFIYLFIYLLYRKDPQSYRLLFTRNYRLGWIRGDQPNMTCSDGSVNLHSQDSTGWGGLPRTAFPIEHYQLADFIYYVAWPKIAQIVQGSYRLLPTWNYWLGYGSYRFFITLGLKSTMTWLQECATPRTNILRENVDLSMLSTISILPRVGKGVSAEASECREHENNEQFTWVGISTYEDI